MNKANVTTTYSTPSSSLLETALIYVLPIALIFGFLIWLNRRAQGQMSGIMSIGRSRAKLYTTERPRTTFGDVAGYPGVKQEISEVVDFLKSSARFRDIGARVPKGVLLVGPPGTGKTLLARAVAGEAGVPFLSVSGSDFMEMFVGVGASRVRDLFQTARKQAPAIIFVDEIDSIGRKRGAGLGGGHDEREQTLNQMLNEMDGFDPTEGVVIMAATNRPDILDPALLRPGRFDRQIVVPLPDLEERLPILQVHCRDKRVSEDVDLMIVARGTPGMSGAELANLVNEAALHAVRRGSQSIQMRDFDAARDRVLMGQPREVHGPLARREGARRLPRGWPRRPRLRPSQRRPAAQGQHHPDRHGPRGHPAAARRGAAHLPAGSTSRTRSPCGWAAAWRRSSSTAASPPARATTCSATPSWPARWSGSGACPTGSGRWPGAPRARSSSARTSCTRGTTPRTRAASSTRRSSASCAGPSRRPTGRSTEHRLGLDAVAKALLEHETIDGREIARLVDEAFGQPVHGSADGEVPDQTRFASSLSGIGGPPPPPGNGSTGTSVPTS